MVQLVEGGGVVDEADVPDVEDGLQVVADGALEVLEAVLVGQAEDVHDEVVLELAEVDLAGVDVAEEELERGERRVAELDLVESRLAHPAEEERAKVLGARGQDDAVGVEPLALHDEGHVGVFVI